MTSDKSKIYFWFFVILTSVTCFTSILLFKPVVAGDGFSYIEAIEVLRGGSIPSDFVPNRITANFYGLELIIFLSKIFGSVESAWILLNVTFFFIFVLVFYKLVRSIFGSDKTAFLAGLFLVTNYAVISFGLNYLMDIGGWMFYVVSLYLTLKYTEQGEKKLLLYSAVFIGFGGLFKEYAFLGVVPIAVVLIYENWPRLFSIVKKATIPALIVIAPVIPIYLMVYEKFGYTYANWFSANSEHYVYSSRIIEYVKSLGSLYTFLAFLVIGGFYYYIRERKEIVEDKKIQVLILSILLSVIPIFIWPAITQRILFITVPATIIIASFLFKKFEKYWWVFLLPLILYIFINFNMNYILANFNLPF